ncbi:hypothetical protein F975_01873 [Acinetobacter sp. ANC 3789]|uniref:hypothetical protein n=1 Tax=Acinetobacter sp. ANC 3789 TaxID=1217714 RepID=UPI0002CFDB4A|nr:hypothetical protein [Acinetobacter sp. ANC 3789]ENU80120.1 hypothetical protein F975_01873 [Acinetobacter sp. ANC 3789]
MSNKIINANSIHYALVKGLHDTWNEQFYMTDDPYNNLRPEYLTTASVCYSLADFVSSTQLRGYIIVRAEELTKKIWKDLNLVKSLNRNKRKNKKKKIKFKKDSARKGNTDITLFQKLNGHECPFAIIENKEYLKFTKQYKMYSASRNEFKKDIKRNIEFLNATRFPNTIGIEYTAFTFFINDTYSTTETESKDFLKHINRYFQKLFSIYKKKYRDLIFEFEIGSLIMLLPSSTSQQEYICDDGSKDDTCHQLYGVISIFRNGQVICGHI